MGFGAINVDVGSILQNLGSVGGLFKDIRTAITGKAPLDPTKLAELEGKAQEIEANLMQAQIDINKIEAASTSIFVAGWRPFVGWICGIALFYHFIGYSLFQWVIAFSKIQVVAPAINTEGLLTVLFAMLGLGTLRTLEKVKGAEGNR